MSKVLVRDDMTESTVTVTSKATSSEASPGFHINQRKYVFDDLVELNVSTKSNDFSDGFALDICATVGEYIIEVLLPEGSGGRLLRRLVQRRVLPNKWLFRVRLLHCRLRYSLAGCEILPETKYRYLIQVGTFSAEVQNRFKLATKVDFSGSVNGAANAGAAAIGANIAAKAGVAASNNVDGADEASAKITPEIAVVEHAPFGWTIGYGPLGDPVQAASDYCLRGSYFLQQVARYPHSCQVKFLEGFSLAKLTFDLSVRDGLYVERINDDVAKRARESDKWRVVEEMRRKLAGMALEKQLKANDELVVENEGLLLARVSGGARCDRTGLSTLGNEPSGPPTQPQKRTSARRGTKAPTQPTQPS